MQAALTPIATVLGNVFASSPAIRVLNYQLEFSNLWQAELEGATISEIKAILICGSKPPAEAFEDLIPLTPNAPVDFADHFTAYSWATAFRLINREAEVRIVILSDSIPQGTAADLCALLMPKDANLSALVPGITCLTSPSLTEIIAAISCEAPQPLRLGQQAMLRAIIHQHLLPNQEDHHKLGNILGALMLSPDRSLGCRLLGGLFRALQPETTFAGTGTTDFALIDKQLKRRVATASQFVLFDDMGSIWAAFVRRWVPSERLHLPEVSEASRSRLISRLKTLADQPVQRRKLNASDFGVVNIVDGESFILLLDLRLFSGDKADDEVQFVDALKELAVKINKASHLKWPTFPENEMREVEEAWYLKQPFSQNYRKARSWLPRLISLIDPTLPIVIFSSTQDPEVLREFRHYGNIVTDFAKPMFRGVMGEAKEWAGAATLAFEKALDSALKISSTQSGLRALCRPFERSEAKQVNRDAPARVEIFIDESGEASHQRFALGALVLISGATAFDHGLYRTAATQGGLNAAGLWGLDDVAAIRGLRDLPNEDLWLRKGKDLDTGKSNGVGHNMLLNVKLGVIESLVAQQGGQLLTCSLLSQEMPEPSSIASVKHPFHRYRDMLTRILDAILFHVDPVVRAIERGAEICIDAATAKNSGDNWNLNRLCEDFGAESFLEQVNGRSVMKCRTLAKSHILPIVSGLLLRNAREGLAGRVVRARAAQLSEFIQCSSGTLFNEKRLDPKPLHYLADWMAHITWDERDWIEVPNIPVLNRWFTLGFRQVDGIQLKTQLNCHRRWSQQARVAAIRGLNEAAPRGASPESTS